MIIPIFITGCARSRTSLTAGIIKLCGAWGGSLVGANKYNPKGFFENSAIKRQLIKPYLKNIKADPLGQNPLPKTNEIIPDPRWRKKVLNILKSQGMPNDQNWFIKEAKLCLMWPLWHKAFPEAKWVIVRRKADDIVKSCLRTPAMAAFNKRADWLEWIRKHRIKFIEMKQSGLNLKEVWPERIICGDFGEIKSIINWLGLQWNEKEVISLIIFN